MSIFQKMQDMDRRIYYVVLAVLMLIPLVKPLPLPLKINTETKAAFDTIEKLPAGSVVLIGNNYTPPSEPELWPQTIVVTRHALKRGLKVVFHNISLSGEMYSLRMADLLKKEGQYKYGEDFLALPYKAGGESVVAQMGRDFRGLYQNDMYGTALGQVPLWDRVKTVKDFSAVINFVSAQDGLFYISQLEKQYGITLVYGGTAVFGPQMTNFFQTGQVKGLVMGLSGAAEYELIAGFPGKATSGMSAQSVSHAFIILLIIMGNIGYFGSKRRKEVAL